MPFWVNHSLRLESISLRCFLLAHAKEKLLKFGDKKEWALTIQTFIQPMVLSSRDLLDLRSWWCARRSRHTGRPIFSLISPIFRTSIIYIISTNPFRTGLGRKITPFEQGFFLYETGFDSISSNAGASFDTQVSRHREIRCREILLYAILCLVCSLQQ